MFDLVAIAKIGAEKHSNNIDGLIQYGTAGFRTKAVRLNHVMYRMGVLAALRSMQKKAAIGVMITASHNPAPDNGVKLVDPKGDMLEPKWEELSTELANAKDADLQKAVEKIISLEGIDTNQPSLVFIGQDTRPSSEQFCQAVIDGVNASGGQFKSFGLLSTPELHYLVVCHNGNGAYGEPSEEGYLKKLTSAFLEFRGEKFSNGNYEPTIFVDGANGVGAEKMRKFSELLGTSLNITLDNDGSLPDDHLNENCGADFVKVSQKVPKKFENYVDGQRCASLDGDADRLIYFYTNKKDGFVLLDGDKIATLIAGYVMELVTASHLDITIGLVQTAYSNGSSTKYINEVLNVPVACVPTGVKFLHHKAQEFDIGIYFEANGHGTVVYSDKAVDAIRAKAKEGQIEAARKLELLMDMTNTTVGDAISDLLVVESVLHARGWSVEDWNTAYQDLPNRQLKVLVGDRNVITTTDAERRVVTPIGLQDKIDEIVKKFKSGRAFVRPSGTEDIVRVYAEAATQDEANQLAYEVGLEVHGMAGGVGQPTPKP